MARISVSGNIDAKLMFVKLIKDATGMGLKESKDLCDWLTSNMNKNKEINFTSIESEINFRNELVKNNIPASIGMDLTMLRDIKILQLGIGEKSEYKKFIIDYIDISCKEDCEVLISQITEMLTDEDLKKIIDVIYDNNIKYLK